MRFLMLDRYYLEAENQQLREIAGTILMDVYNDFLIEEGKRPVFVLLNADDLSALPPAYYLRIILLKHPGFHLYGIEVKEGGDVLVHENIQLHLLSSHADVQFKKQLMALNQKEKIVFRMAVKQGGGMDLHTDLVRQYVCSGQVGKSFESRYQLPFTKSVGSVVASVSATERTPLIGTGSTSVPRKPLGDYSAFRADKLPEQQPLQRKTEETTLDVPQPVQVAEQESPQQRAAKRFFEIYKPGSRSYWVKSKLNEKASLSAIVEHAVSGSKIGFFSSYSGKNTKETLVRLGVTEVQLKANALDEIAACLNRR